jgi:hypothetical protein
MALAWPTVLAAGASASAYVLTTTGIWESAIGLTIAGALGGAIGGGLIFGGGAALGAGSEYIFDSITGYDVNKEMDEMLANISDESVEKAVSQTLTDPESIEKAATKLFNEIGLSDHAREKIMAIAREIPSIENADDRKHAVDIFMTIRKSNYLDKIREINEIILLPDNTDKKVTSSQDADEQVIKTKHSAIKKHSTAAHASQSGLLFAKKSQKNKNSEETVSSNDDEMSKSKRHRP